MAIANLPENLVREYIIPTARRMKDPHSALMDAPVREIKKTETAKSANLPKVKAEPLTFNQGPNINPADALPAMAQNGPTVLTCKVLANNNLAPSANLEKVLKDLWLKNGHAHIIAAKHTEFVVEPKVFIGDKLNPDILKIMVINYLSRPRTNVQISGDKLVIKSPKGNPLVTIYDPKIIQRYLSQASQN